MIEKCQQLPIRAEGSHRLLLECSIYGYFSVVSLKSVTKNLKTYILPVMVLIGGIMDITFHEAHCRRKIME